MGKKTNEEVVEERRARHKKMSAVLAGIIAAGGIDGGKIGF